MPAASGCYGPMATMGCDPRFSPYGMSGGMGCGMAGCTPCGMTPGSLPRVCSCHIESWLLDPGIPGWVRIMMDLSSCFNQREPPVLCLHKIESFRVDGVHCKQSKQVHHAAAQAEQPERVDMTQPFGRKFDVISGDITPLMFFFLGNRFHLEIWSRNLLIEEMPRKSTWLECIFVRRLTQLLGWWCCYLLSYPKWRGTPEVGWNHLHHWVYLPGAGLPPGWEQARVDEVCNYQMTLLGYFLRT